MSDKHLDPNVLSTLQEVMEDEYPALVDTFLSDSEQRLQLLKKAADATQLFEAAHSFKGSSSNMGAVQLAELCHQLELRAREQNLSGIEALVAEIDREFALVRPLYEEERRRSSSASVTVRR